MPKRASHDGWRSKSQCRRSGEFQWKSWHRRKHRGCQPSGSESPPGRNTFCWTKEAKDDRLPEPRQRRGGGWGAHPFPRGCAAQWRATRSSIQQGCGDYPNQEKKGKEQQRTHGSQKAGGEVPVKPPRVNNEGSLGLQAGCATRYLQPISSLLWCQSIGFTFQNVSYANTYPSSGCTCKSCFFQASHMKCAGLSVGSWGTAPAPQPHSSHYRGI